MPQIGITGRAPASILENSRPGDWVAAFAVSGDIARITGVEVQDSLAFSVAWNPATATATVRPAAVIDYEAFTATGTLPQVSFNLSFAFDDGSHQSLPSPIRVAVVDVDDTPPSALRFASGGSVTAGAIGVTIGTLAVTDPDTAGPFRFSFAEEDAWKFEVVGNVLKLKDGISLGLDDTPSRPLFIEVSDGRQSAGFTLDLTVRDPGGFEAIPAQQPPADSLGGFSLTATGAATPQGNAFGLRESRELVAANRYEDTAVQLTLKAGGELWLPAVDTLRLADGRLEFGTTGTAARADALHQATLGGAADGRALGSLVTRAEAGQSWADIAATLLSPAQAALGDGQFVTQLFHAALDRDPTAAELALQTGRLASGLGRGQLAADLAFAEAVASNGDPHWVFAPLGSGDWRADVGGIAPVAAAVAAPAAAWLF